MLAAPSTPTYAYYNKTEKLFGEKGLSDNEKQVCVEIWKYSPTILSENKNAADPLSVIISLRDKRGDERVEQAIEDFLNTLWRH